MKSKNYGLLLYSLGLVGLSLMLYFRFILYISEFLFVFAVAGSILINRQLTYITAGIFFASALLFANFFRTYNIPNWLWLAYIFVLLVLGLVFYYLPTPKPKKTAK